MTEEKVSDVAGFFGKIFGNKDESDHGGDPSATAGPPPLDEVGKAVRDLVIAEFARHDITATLDDTGDEYALHLSNGSIAFLDNMIANAREIERDEWPQFVSYMVTAQLEAQNRTEPEDMSEDELRQRIRTRLLSDVEDDLVDTSYARAFAPGIVQALCVDYPDTVTTLPSSALDSVAMTVDDLFAQGQANTDAEPIGEQFEINEFVKGLTGDSLFIASKAANLGALVPEVTGTAPLGIVFAIPNRSLLLYSVITQDEWINQLMGVVQTADSLSFSPDFHHPGGLVSPYTYYWAPDGTVERIGGRQGEEGGEPKLAIAPSGIFSEYVNIDEGSESS